METRVARPLVGLSSEDSNPGLPLITIAGLDDNDDEADLRILRKLGAGGTATVYEAIETCIGRRVAVKVPRDDLDVRWVNEKILREARVAQVAEHPNVVPVYRVGRDQQGRVLLVMKLIEGEPWSAVLRRSPDDIIGAVSTMISVCRALELAHSRGLLHLDLNPSNVLVGSFGEVYVSDWGIARAVSDIPGVPSASQVVDIEGTPAYMPPEMVVPGKHAITEQTDIYILGSTLFRVLTGDPPRPACSIDELRKRAQDAEPLQLPSSIPKELRDLVRESTQAQPSRRPVCVAEFRCRLEVYLRNSSSRVFLERAARGLNRLKNLAATEPTEVCSVLAREVQIDVRLALRKWPDSPAATQLAEALAGVMVDRELSRGNSDGADLWLADVPSDRMSDARSRSAQARKRSSDEENCRTQRAQMASERVISSHMSARLRATRLHILLVGVPMFTLAMFDLAGAQVPRWAAAWGVCGLLLVSSVAGLHGPKHMRAVNDINRRWSGVNISLSIFVAAGFVICHFAGMDFIQAAAIAMLVCAAVLGGAMLLLDFRGLATSAIFLITGVLISAMPQFAHFTFVAGVSSALAALVMTWRRLERNRNGARAP